MTEREYILARLQVEREQAMARWNVAGPSHARVQPREPRRLVAAVQAEQRRREAWRGTAA